MHQMAKVSQQFGRETHKKEKKEGNSGPHAQQRQPPSQVL
jgi:hypothetical protein